MLPGGVRLDRGRCGCAARAAYASAVAMIRLAGLDDVDALRTIAVAAYGKYVPRMGRAPAPMTADYAEAIRSRQAWAAIEDGRIAGFAVPVARPGYLPDNVAVLLTAQNRGIGTRLLGLAEDHARSLGLSEIRLYANEAMTENPACYARRGHVETHRTEQDGFHRVFFRNPSADHPIRGMTAPAEMRRGDDVRSTADECGATRSRTL
jgi:GNAT superfamily N-acetyltransferase